MKTSWRKLVREAMTRNGENLSDLVATTLSQAEFNAAFETPSVSPQGKHFTAWSAKYVYFPAWVGGQAEFDYEYVASAPRHVQRSIAVEHVGYA